MAEEGYPGKEAALPVPDLSAERFRSEFEGYAARLARNKAVRDEIGIRGPSDDTFKRRLEIAEADDERISAAAETLDKFLPHPRGESWFTVLDERADAIREEWAAADEG